MPVTLRRPHFRPDLDQLRDAITSRTRLILLNSPHNPTGMVATREELAALAALAVKHDLLVVTDEVYEHLVYEGEHIPIATFPGMRDRTVSISSGGKTFSFTGWKIGWITGTAALVAAVRTAKQFLTYVSGGPFQYAIAAGLALPDSFYSALAADLHAKRDLLAGGLRGAGFEVFLPQGTYFITTDITPLGETTAWLSAAACRGAAVSSPSRTWCSTTGRGGAQPGQVRVLQAGRRTARRGEPAQGTGRPARRGRAVTPPAGRLRPPAGALRSPTLRHPERRGAS